MESNCEHKNQNLAATSADLLNDGSFDPKGKPSCYFYWCDDCGYCFNPTNDPRVPKNISEWQKTS